MELPRRRRFRHAMDVNDLGWRTADAAQMYFDFRLPGLLQRATPCVLQGGLGNNNGTNSE